MPLSTASAKPSDASEAAKVLRRKTPLLPSDFAQLDREAKKRAFTVTDEVSLDAIRDMRDALAKAKADGIEYLEFVKTIGAKLDAQWGIDSPQLKTVFVNNVQQAANQAIVARLNRQRGKFPFWTLDVVKDEVTSATCGYFITHPVVLPAGHPWWAKNAPMRHHRCRTTLRGLTAAEAQKIGISKSPPDWPADEGWGGSAPMGEYKANMSDVVAMADQYAHIDFTIPKGVREEAQRGLDWRKEFGRGGTSVGIATARTLVSAERVSPAKAKHIAEYFPWHEVDKKGQGYSPGAKGFPSKGRIAWALWGGDAGRAWSNKLVAQMRAADKKAKTMKDKLVKNDLGQGDVHADGLMAVRRPKRAKAVKPGLAKSLAKVAPKRLGKVVNRRGLSFRFARGGTSIEVRHMKGNGVTTLQCGSVELDENLFALDDAGQPPKLVWIQLAKVGTFRGHPSGPFELTPLIFAEIVRNFHATQNQRIPIDFEHASEQDPTQGSIPTAGAPSQGWICDLDNRGNGGLWGLVEWLEPARTYIREKKYKFFSPAIRFGSKDRVTGQPIGARMTSGALTNNPFLDGMVPLAASDRGAGTSDEPTITENQFMGGDYAHSMAEMAPRLRASLFESGTHQSSMGTLAECYDAVCRLENLVDEFRDANPEADLMTAKHAGIDLGGALMKLRDAMQLGLGVTVPEMLALVKEMIENAIGVHEDELHSEREPASQREMGNRQMGTEETGVKLRDAENKVAVLMSEKTQLETKVAGLELQLADRSSKLTTLEFEVKTLRDNEAKRAENDETAAIELAFATYKDTHKLTDAHKKSMLLTYRHDRATFDQLYPPVAPDQRHLQRTLSNRQSPGVQQGYGAPVQLGGAHGQGHQGQQGQYGQQAPANFALAHFDLTQKLMSDEKMPLEKATVEARRRLTTPPGVTT